MANIQKKAENSYQFAEENFRRIFENLPDVVFVTDRQGNVLLSNSTAALTLDMSLDQLLKSNINDLVREGYYDKSYAMEVVEKKCAISGVLTTKLNFTQASSSTPVFDENGDVILVITTGRPKGLNNNQVCIEERQLNNQRKREVEYLRSHVLETDTIVAESMVMRQVLLKAHNVAQTDSTVLLYGETGTGKEILAKYLHRHSKRSNEAFIAINCSNLPEQLVESELFGYDKGAFTGACSQGKMGLFEAAHRGTLFLDEIAELPLVLQAKLLRVLENGEVRRIGSYEEKKIDFRLIAATNKDLKKMTEDGLFRSDLYYRLDVIAITIPPLRSRPEDIAALSAKFLKDMNKKYGTDIEFDADTLALFQNYNWRGNVRELRNSVEKKVINSLQKDSSEALSSAALASKMCCNYDTFSLLKLNGTLKEVMNKVEEQYIRKVLKTCGGRIGMAADKLGIYRTVLYRKLKKIEKQQSL